MSFVEWPLYILTTEVSKLKIIFKLHHHGNSKNGSWFVLLFSSSSGDQKNKETNLKSKMTYIHYPTQFAISETTNYACNRSRLSIL